MAGSDTGIGRFFRWMTNKRPADTLLTEREKESYGGQSDKQKAVRELEEEEERNRASAKPTPTN